MSTTSRITDRPPQGLDNMSFEVTPTDNGQWEVYASWPGTDKDGYDGSGYGVTIEEAISAAVADAREEG